jgi:NAD(P)-dependent dehydrogenase (short-subunit alcohol dehydrogenase family)
LNAEIKIMKIIIIGGNGTIGKVVAEKLKHEHDVIIAGARTGDLLLDLGRRDSILSFFEKTGHFDALINAAGAAYLAPIRELEEQHFRIGLESKLLGQINLVLIGQRYINKGGSFTLTSGIVAEEPIRQGVAAMTVDAAVNAFVKAASTELTNDVRINAVAPGVVEGSPHLHQYFPGHIPVSMEKVGMAYLKSLLGVHNGEVIRAY